MYYFTAVAIGTAIAIMIAINGNLTVYHGTYTATVIIHIVGLLFTSIVLLKKHLKLFPSNKLPLLLYSGGAIGVLTTIFNNVAFGSISLSAILALNLLGQSITSLIIDEFGLWNTPKRHFMSKKIIGLGFVILGIAFMIFPLSFSNLLFVIVSLLSGATVVISRTINAQLAENTCIWNSTFWNFAVGLLIAIAILPILGTSEPFFSVPIAFTRFYIYLGGLFGVLVVALSNFCVRKISSFYMTLFVFVGQLFSGIVLDIFLSNQLSFSNLIGGICVTIGLSFNLIMDKNDSKFNENQADCI